MAGGTTLGKEARPRKSSTSHSAEEARHFVERASRLGTGVYSLRRYQIGRAGRSGLVFGYSSLAEQEIEEGLARLARAFPR